MNRAEKRVEAILKDEFRMESFIELVREIFSTLRLTAPDHFYKEYSSFASHVEGFCHVGKYETPEGKRIGIFAVALKRQAYVENSRSTQRSYAKSLMESGSCDAALIAFYTPDDWEKKWRLSFVRLDYKMTVREGRLKAEEELTPAKRYSYLVGAGEPCHTAIGRFRIFITDKSSRPTFDELEEAFSVEAVTREFFELYRQKFGQLAEYLESNDDFIQESRRCGFTSGQFAKKLMGQVVFLYFLQKKGWLGGGVWNPVLTEKEYNRLFFISGAQGRIIKEYLPKIYFRQGEEYKFRPSALDQIPDDAEELIANRMPGDRNWGSGSRTFLRTLFEFSRRRGDNFFEDYLEPLFYEVLNTNRGVPGYSTRLHCRIPFLSGGLFEPIDHYDWKSCRFNIPDLIFSHKQDEADRNGDGILDIFDRYNFTMSEDEPMEREVAIDPEMLGKVFENLLDVRDRKSKGAFYTPREIVHYMCQESLVSYLTAHLEVSPEAVRSFILYGDFYKDRDTQKTLKVRDGDGRIHYEWDPGRPLLISPEIFCPGEGVNRIREIDELLKSIRVADPAVGSGAFPLGMLNEIVRARQNLTAYMAASMSSYDARLLYVHDRSPYQLKYDTIKNCIFAADIEPSAADITRLRLWLALVIDDEINPTAQNPLEGHRDPLPLPNLECNILCGNSLMDEFAKVFQEKAGFDVVIGNPPYVDSEEMTRSMPKEREIYTRKFACARGNWDLFVPFIEKGVELLKADGVISYIVPNKLVAAPYTEVLREKLSRYQIMEMRDYSQVTVFKSAAVYPIVFRMKKNPKKISVAMEVMEDMDMVSSHNLVEADQFYQDIYWDKYFHSSQEALQIIRKMSSFTPLKRIAQVNGAATVGEAYQVKEYLYEDAAPGKGVKKFINTGALDPYRSFWGKEPIRYLKGKYINPSARAADIGAMSAKRLKESNEKKIIIGGMTRILECYYDAGEYLAGKSTTIVYGHENLKYITALLNSRLMTFYYRTFYNSMSLSGGFYRIGTPQIRELPIAFPEKKVLVDKIEKMADRIQALYAEEGGEAEIQELRNKIDRSVCQIYGLTDAEIRTVEEAR